MRSWLLPLLSLGLGAAVAHQAQLQADRARQAEQRNRTLYVPAPEAIRIASMGYNTIVADVMWVRAVLSFADAYQEGEVNPEAAVWLRAYLETISTLDPLWRTTYYHGGGMLRVLGDVEGSDAIFTLGLQNLPEEPYFPFSLAMNAYLIHKDRETASQYLDMAAALPASPPWYRAAAAGFLSESGQRQTALRYLKEQLDSAQDPSVRESVQKKLNELLHEELAAQIEARRSQAPALEGLGELPPDPYQEGWIIAPDGEVRSRFVERAMVARFQQIERGMLMDRARH